MQHAYVLCTQISKIDPIFKISNPNFEESSPIILGEFTTLFLVLQAILF